MNKGDVPVPVRSKYSRGSAVELKQAAETIATMNRSMYRSRRWGRE